MMPYELRSQDGKYCIFNKDTGESKGCSDSKDMAVKHIRALYAAESGSLKNLDGELVDISNDCMCAACCINEDDYKEFPELSNIIGLKAAWPSSYINSLPNSAFAYVEPGCDSVSCKHFPIKNAQGEYDAAHVRNALARLSQSPHGSKASAKVHTAASALGIGGNTKKEQDDTLVDKLLNGIKGLLFPSVEGPITLYKQADGRIRVMMRMSNMFKDRHGEIITSSAHKEYEAYVSESGDYPRFDLWHIKGTKWGQADLVSFDDGFLTVSGLADVGKEYIAEALAEQAGSIGVSHGFKGFSVEGNGLIDHYRSFEVSPLPRSEAANVWTAYMLAKNWERGMGLADKHKKFFESLHVPSDVIATWDKDSRDMSSILKDAGIEYKEFEDAVDGVKQTRAAHAMMAKFHTDAASAMNDTEDKTEAPEKPGEKPDKEDKKEPAEKSVTSSISDTTITLDDVMKSIGTLQTTVNDLSVAHKALDNKVKDAVASTLEAAIVPGASAGFQASKQGEPPTNEQSAANTAWEEELANLIIGAKS